MASDAFPGLVHVARAKTCSVLSAELQAIKMALDYILTLHSPNRKHVIATDSQEALQAMVKGNGTKRGREALQGTLQTLRDAERSGLNVTFVWVPAHTGNAGNECAHQAAQTTTETGTKPSRNSNVRIRESGVVQTLLVKDLAEQKRLEAQTPRTKRWGQYTWRLDAALPGKHTLKLYGALNSEQSGILVQARTNHTHLRSHLAKIGVEESSKCECGQEDETVAHVLLRCQRWTSIRAELRQIVGNRWGDLSFLLGGYSKKREMHTDQPVDGPLEWWRPNLKMVKAAVRFLQQTTRMAAIPPQQQEGSD